MLSSKTIQMSIEVLEEQLSLVNYSERRGDLAGPIAQRKYMAAKKGIEEYEEIYKAINELSREFKKAVENENATKA